MITSEMARQHQYLIALRRWADLCEQTHTDLVVIDSSDGDISMLSEYAATRSGQIQIRQYPPPNRLREAGVGKGVGEAVLIDEAFTDTTLGLVKYPMVFKCTGRLVIKNWIRASADVRLGLRASVRGDLRWMDSRSWGAPGSIWARYFVGMSSHIDESAGKYLEHVVLERCLTALGDGEPFDPWPRLPRFVGTSGSYGSSYDRVDARLKRTLHDLGRHVLRRLPPTL